MYWSGQRVAYKPEHLKIPKEVKIKHIGAAHGAVCAVSSSSLAELVMTVMYSG